MNARGVSNLAHSFAGIRIDNHDLGGARNVQAPRLAIHLQVIPSTLAPQFPGIHEVISGSGRGHGSRQQHKHDGRNKHAFFCFHKVLAKRQSGVEPTQLSGRF